MQAAYFATPIIYPISMIMAMNATAAKVLMLSPMTQIIQDARLMVVYDGNSVMQINEHTVWNTDVVWNTIHSPLVAIIPIVIVAVVSVIAVLYFRRASRRFTELV